MKMTLPFEQLIGKSSEKSIGAQAGFQGILCANPRILDYNISGA
jgi:hypothetical protein